MRNLSPSAISTYLNCPLNYYITYVLKGDRIQSEAAEIGTVAHEAFQKFFDHVEEDNCSVDEFRDILFSLTDEKYHNDCAYFFQNFAEFEYRRYRNVIDNGLDFNKYFIPIAREERLWSDELGLNGIIDRIDRINNKEFAVVDYKTGKNNPRYKSDIRRQMCIYTMLVDKSMKFDFKPEWIIGIYPRYSIHDYQVNDGKKESCIMFAEKLKKATVNATLRAIKKVRYGIENEIFNGCPSKLCGWCSHPEKCNELIGKMGFGRK